MLVGASLGSTADMALPRTFVGFSGTDIRSYHLMCAWKEHEHIDFDFCDCQLDDAINSTNEQYIKQRCRARLQMAGTYILLIGPDTQFKTTYVKWEAEVAIEKKCRLIGVNLDNWKVQNPYTCPQVFMSAGALFVPFSPKIVARALDPAHWQRPTPLHHDHYYFEDWMYRQLGYTIEGYIAKLPPKPPPFFVQRRRL